MVGQKVRVKGGSGIGAEWMGVEVLGEMGGDRQPLPSPLS
jgi:hypothetical protein